MEDAVFTFDTKSMKTAMDSISTSLSGLKDMIENMTTSVGKKTKKGIDDVTSGTKKKTKEIGTSLKTSVSNFSEGSSQMLSMVAKKVMGLAAAYLSLRSVMKGVPEIGRVFSHAGDIITRSLFWPLRKVLLPLLQKILDWTRDHRVMFVKWGTMIANAFRAVYQIVLGVIKLVKTFVDSFMRTFEGLFGKITGRMSDTLNIIMFKLTAVFMYVMELIRPLIETLGANIAKITYLFSELWEGFKESMKGLTPALEDLFSSMNKLLGVEGDLIEKGGAIVAGFRIMGNVIGEVLMTAIAILAQTFDTLGYSIGRATKQYLLWRAARSDNNAEFIRLFKEMGKAEEEYNKSTQDRWASWWKNTKDIGGNIKRASTGASIEDEEAEEAGKKAIKIEKEKIIKFKKEHPFIPGAKSSESTIKMSPISITVTNLTDTKTVGKDIANSISYSLERELKTKLDRADSGVAH